MSRKLTTEEFIQKAKRVHGNTYDYSKVNYENKCIKISIICKHHGEFSQSPDNHLQKRGCPICRYIKSSKGRRKTLEKTIEDFKKIHGDAYDYSLVEYKNSGTKVKIICLKHGIFCQIPENHLQGKGCPKCKSSIGENLIRLWLEKYKIDYVNNYFISDCKYDKILPFDFYLPKTNTLIEFDGEQHFKPVRFKGISLDKANKNFKEQQKRDDIKTKYCLMNNFRLIRIPYFKLKKIDSILERIV